VSRRPRGTFHIRRMNDLGKLLVILGIVLVIAAGAI
jgi:hypothetical protein